MAEEEKLSATVMEAVRAGRKIEAIKRLRAERGLGLKEAKHIVDREFDAYRSVNPNAALQQDSGPWPLIFVVALIASAIYFFLAKDA